MILSSVGHSLSSTTPALFGISLAIATALLGALFAALKIPTDRGTAAMAQAQGANEALSEALEAVERERDYWIRRHTACRDEKNELLKELADLKSERRQSSD